MAMCTTQKVVYIPRYPHLLRLNQKERTIIARLLVVMMKTVAISQIIINKNLEGLVFGLQYPNCLQEALNQST
jgi:hypothetical protein